VFIAGSDIDYFVGVYWDVSDKTALCFVLAEGG